MMLKSKKKNTKGQTMSKMTQQLPLCTHTHTHPFNGPFPGLPRSAGIRKVKTIRILVKQETVSGSGVSWAICNYAPRSRKTTTPAPHHSVFFTGRMPFLPPNQQCQSTEGTKLPLCTRTQCFYMYTLANHMSCSMQSNVQRSEIFRIYTAFTINEEKCNSQKHEPV